MEAIADLDVLGPEIHVDMKSSVVAHRHIVGLWNHQPPSANISFIQRFKALKNEPWPTTVVCWLPDSAFTADARNLLVAGKNVAEGVRGKVLLAYSMQDCSNVQSLQQRLHDIDWHGKPGQWLGDTALLQHPPGAFSNVSNASLHHLTRREAAFFEDMLHPEHWAVPEEAIDLAARMQLEQHVKLDSLLSQVRHSSSCV